MLERAGAAASKPENLGSEFGLNDGKYQLTEVQAQAILDLRLHRLTEGDTHQDRRLSRHSDRPGALACGCSTGTG